MPETNTGMGVYTLNNPATDLKGGERLEECVREIAKKCRPHPNRPPLTFDEVCGCCRMFFKKELPFPLSPAAVLAFLPSVGVEVDDKKHWPTDATFAPIQGQWRIFYKPRSDLLDNLSLLHDFWEVLFWRCCHVIEWWPDWARSIGILDPHKKADAFAYNIILPRDKFRNRAKKELYDPWKLSKVCHCTPHAAMHAMSRTLSWGFPVLFTWLTMGCSQREDSLFPDLFTDYVPMELKFRASKKARACGIDNEDDENDEKYEDVDWQSVVHLGKQLGKRGVIREVSPNDVVYQAAQQKPFSRLTADNVLGIKLQSPVVCFVRTSERSTKEIWLQVIPSGCEAHFFDAKYNRFIELM